MNLDNPNDHRELNLRVDRYTICEVVALPPNFDIKSFLSMREQMGMFKADHIDSYQLEKLSMGVTCSPIFLSMNNALLNPHTVAYFLYILDELDLIIKSVYNPIRRSYGDKPYLEFCKRWEDERYSYIAGQEVKRINFVIINLVQLFQQNIIDEAKQVILDLEKFQDDASKTMKELIREG